MIKTLEIGKVYRIVLNKNIWKEETAFNVRISGITKKNSTELFSSYDIKQYNKSHIDINNLHYEVMKIYKYESYMRFIEKRNKRINEIDNKKIKKFFNKIKHQTKCTTERVFNLMKFEDEF